MIDRRAAILAQQNEIANITLLRASTVAYSRAKAGEMRITCGLLALAVAYPIGYLLADDDSVRLILFGCSFLLSVLMELVRSSHRRHTSNGALFKEEFDTSIFGLRWKSTLTRPDRSEIIHFSQMYRGREIKDWYSTALSASIQHNTAVAVLQHSNTSWDIGLRKMYRNWVMSFLTLYSVVLCAALVVLKVDALTIFLIQFSLLSFYGHFIALIRGHSLAIERREGISRHLESLLRDKRHIGMTELRDIQDEIYLTRNEAAKVPNFFFEWFRVRFNAETEQYIREINDIYG